EEVTTLPWQEICVTPAGKGLLIVTSKVTVTVAPSAMVPMLTATLVSPPVLPVVTEPCVVVTEPTTSWVLSGARLVKTAPAAFWLPVLVMTTVYCSVSPGLTCPLAFTSTTRATVLSALITGAETTGMTVGSVGPGGPGSSVSTPVGSEEVTTLPWQEICVTPAGKGLLIVTSKVTVTVAPSAMVPMLTATLVSPPVLPVVTEPCVVVTEPTTSWVLSGARLVKTAPAAFWLPVLVMTTVYCSVSPGLTCPLAFTSTTRATVLSALITGAETTGMTVGSVGPGGPGSSVSTPVGSEEVTTLPWQEICVTPAGKGLLIVTSKVTVTVAPSAMVPMLTATLVSPPVLPVVTEPCVVVTEPTTSWVLSGARLVKTAPAAFWLPVLVMTTVYCSVSPGLTCPLAFTSTTRATVLSALITGAETTGMTVGSVGPGGPGSSVSTPVGSEEVTTLPWQEICVTPAGKGLLIVTSKVTVTVAPSAMVPMLTATLVSPPVLPVVTEPCVVVTEPTASAVLAGAGLVKITPVAEAPVASAGLFTRIV